LYGLLFDILAIKRFTVAEITLQCHSRSSDSTWFCREHTSFY